MYEFVGKMSEGLSAKRPKCVGETSQDQKVCRRNVCRRNVQNASAKRLRIKKFVGETSVGETSAPFVTDISSQNSQKFRISQ